MKFGKRLKREAHPGWESFYLDYKRLKKVLVIGHEIGSDLWNELLQSELLKINQFYRVMQIKCDEWLALMDVYLSAWKTCSSDQDYSQDVIAFREKGIECLSSGLLLDYLRRYVVLNSIAIVKAIKKRNKVWTDMAPLSAKDLLYRQDFYVSLDLAASVTKSELLAIEFLPSQESIAERAAAQYTCPICLDILRNPVVLSCAHRFCWSCLCSACPEIQSCPYCRKQQPLEPSSFTVDRLLSDFLQKYFPNSHPSTPSQHPDVIVRGESRAFDDQDCQLPFAHDKQKRIEGRFSILDQATGEQEKESIFPSKTTDCPFFCFGEEPQISWEEETFDSGFWHSTHELDVGTLFIPKIHEKSTQSLHQDLLLSDCICIAPEGVFSCEFSISRPDLKGDQDRGYTPCQPTILPSTHQLAISIEVQPPSEIRTRTPQEVRSFQVSVSLDGVDENLQKCCYIIRADLMYAPIPGLIDAAEPVTDGRRILGGCTEWQVENPRLAVLQGMTISEASAKHREREFCLLLRLYESTQPTICLAEALSAPFYAYSHKKVLERRKQGRGRLHDAVSTRPHGLIGPVSSKQQQGYIDFPVVRAGCTPQTPTQMGHEDTNWISCHSENDILDCNHYAESSKRPMPNDQVRTSEAKRHRS